MARSAPSRGDRFLFFLSAASIAIDFLERNPDQRRNIRHIILDEKDRCVGMPECHGLGLIRFCRENPKLRIGRRASIWKTIWRMEAPSNPDDPGYDPIEMQSITKDVARWVVEALDLVPAGMPPGSFTLVLNGNSATEECTRLFQNVQCEAAWQTALGESFDRGILPKTAYHDRRRLSYYFYEGFPQALRAISAGSCRAVCANFCVGEPWDAEAMIERTSGGTSVGGCLDFF
jgi:hypothetical protein